ncbi:MAG TPA: putative lipid II flippase FtsW [Candidatus Eisenbacteria bacterium]|nr:putative lipid II flippase FtsW [Candidatus Eisenbacteria bacterium]
MTRGDRWLIVLPLALTALGVVMVYSSSAILGLTRYQDPHYFLSRQLLRAALGVVALLVFSRLDLKRLKSASVPLLAIAAVLLMVVVAVGHVAKGASRWLKLGFLSLQPTDLARLAAVVFLAWWLERHPPAERGFARGVLVPLAFVGVVAGLVLLQPNLSSAGLLGATGFLMIYLAGARVRHLLVPVAGGVAVVLVMLRLHPYELVRVRSFLDFLVHGTLQARGSGWQLDQSLIAIGSGGWFGRGLGGGLQKYLFLPEAHTDFIFSIFVEELGVVGAITLLAAFAMLLWRGMRTTVRAADDPFRFLLAGGLTLQIGLYALANLAVATGLAPTTGLPLPFVSYGGSALLVNLAMAGLLYRISGDNASHEAVVRQRWAREPA